MAYLQTVEQVETKIIDVQGKISDEKKQNVSSRRLVRSSRLGQMFRYARRAGYRKLSTLIGRENPVVERVIGCNIDIDIS